MANTWEPSLRVIGLVDGRLNLGALPELRNARTK
jgi:hypothetical protein